MPSSSEETRGVHALEARLTAQDLAAGIVRDGGDARLQDAARQPCAGQRHLHAPTIDDEARGGLGEAQTAEGQGCRGEPEIVIGKRLEAGSTSPSPPEVAGRPVEIERGGGERSAHERPRLTECD